MWLDFANFVFRPLILNQNHRSLEIEIRSARTQDFADSQTETQAN